MNCTTKQYILEYTKSPYCPNTFSNIYIFNKEFILNQSVTKHGLIHRSFDLPSLYFDSGKTKIWQKYGNHNRLIGPVVVDAIERVKRYAYSESISF